MGEQVIPTGSNRSTWKQILLAFLANFSTIAPSMSIGFSAIAISVLQKELSITQITWFASIASLATPFGCFFSGPVADRFGRKPALLLVNVVCFLGWMIITAACSTNGSNFPLLMVGRTLTGLSTGLCSSPATIYMAEVASPALRGVFTVWASIFFCLGVLAIYFLGFVLKKMRPTNEDRLECFENSSIIFSQSCVHQEEVVTTRNTTKTTSSSTAATMSKLETLREKKKTRDEVKAISDLKNLIEEDNSVKKNMQDMRVESSVLAQCIIQGILTEFEIKVL